MSFNSGIGPALIATATALAGAFPGVWLAGIRQRARVAVPFSAGVLVGVSAFGLLPELIAQEGWSLTLALFLSGYVLLFAINRHLYPVCPSCSHDHDHHACGATLHGFAAPLVSAAALHSFFDGWNMATAQAAGPVGIRLAVPLAVMIHKLPEGIALGAILRAAVKSRMAALGWCVAAEGCTLAGALFGIWLAPRLGASWVMYPLAIAGGCFFFLGFHAIHGEWRERGAWPAFVPALTGAAGAAALQQSVRALFP